MKCQKNVANSDAKTSFTGGPCDARKFVELPGILMVQFLRCLYVTLSRFVGVLQLGDQKVTLNHPLFLFFVFFPLENQVKNVQNTNHILQYVLGKLYLLRESNLENPSESRPIFVGFIPITWSEVPVRHHQVGSSTKRRHARNGRRPCSTSSRFCLAKSTFMGRAAMGHGLTTLRKNKLLKIHLADSKVQRFDDP